MDLTNNIRKMVAALGESKYRHRFDLFKAEGTKCVMDTLEYFNLQYLIATDDWVRTHNVGRYSDRIIKVCSRDIERMSSLTTAADVIAVYSIPKRDIDVDALCGELVLALDCVQDPGNLGTIIRTADWFGVRTILCNHGTADVYNPKVVQATMGAISRVSMHYCNLPEVLSHLGNKVPVYGTYLDGDNIYSTRLSSSGIIVMGNEGTGISDTLGQCITDRLFIPSYPAGIPTSESLNVGIATAITLSEFRRR